MSTASAAKTDRLGKYEDWAAFQTQESGKRVCYVEAVPKKKEGDYTKRGDVYVQVIHRTVRRGAPAEVGFIFGYPLRKSQKVRVSIGPRNFVLEPDGELAWTRNAAEDRRLVEALIKGRTMIVRGRSTRGTLTTDTYSLMGFSDALQKAKAACGIRR